MTAHAHFNTVYRKRRAGVLLHPTSLPGELGNGDFGHQAYRFIEFLNTHGFKVWQMLPLGPTHDDKSPYQCLSSHAGNSMLISIDWLEDKGWLNRTEISISKSDENYRHYCLKLAAESFYQLDDDYWTMKIAEFISQNASWLEDYALFMALKSKYKNLPWYEWPKPLRHRYAIALDDTTRKLHTSINQTIFEQFVFFTQWQEIRDYAKQHDVELFGDMPIFVARDSADVWAQKENFLIDKDGEMPFISGVPPDAFSDTGQRWGNPLYDWDHMKSTGFSWWKERFETQLELFDMIRIDHFRGLQACWQIPQDDETAINGTWVEVPGREMLTELFRTFDHLPLVAEDLGVITDKVLELKKSFNLPGMKVLQFAFDGNTNNPHLPHRHKIDDVVYTGTHDNDTTLGWASDEGNYNKNYFNGYTGSSNESAEQGVWSMIRLAMSSVSFLCILPMQDLLMLGSSARMNTPGTVDDNNWEWRFEWQQISPEIIKQISHFMNLYQR
ncbi:MAG: 4-alpha-glucanotransferase [Planctomycetia bacterium]|nr:4-alpha-glucanotransferase [Planctomycetia bacterium]